MPRKVLKSEYSADAWRMVERQHGAISRQQLLALGLTPEAVAHRLLTGRLHPVARGVYATARRRRPGAAVHHRALSPSEHTVHQGVPVTTVARTLLDLATKVRGSRLERAINEADKFDLIDPESLRATLDGYAGRAGVTALRTILDRYAFRLTDSELERYFLAIVRRTDLALPDTGTRLNGFKVDFHWPALGLVVETDGLRYHRTVEQQMRDRLRDQAHAAAGLTTLRFTHFQVRYEPRHVQSTLVKVARRLT